LCARNATIIGREKLVRAHSARPNNRDARLLSAADDGGVSGTQADSSLTHAI
jgi:hypothetical protein